MYGRKLCHHTSDVNVWTTRLAKLLVLLVPACQLGTDSRPGDNRGLLVGTFGVVDDLTWSTDGSELYFIEGMFRIRAVMANGSNMRTLYSSGVSVGDLRTTASKVYISTAKSGTPAEYYIVRIDPGSSADVDTVVTYTGSVQSIRFAVSADERFVAFGDSLFDVQAASQRALPRGEPWSFSPDGNLLLYDPAGASSTAEFALISTADLSSQPLPTASGVARPSLFAIGAHYWEDNDPKVLRVVTSAEQDRVQMFIQDMRTGSNRAIGAVTNPPAGLYTSGTISSDGSQAVVMIGAVFLWNELHAIDAQSLERTIVARVNGSAGTDYLAMSPSGARIAYVVFESSGSITNAGAPSVYVVDQ